jgi:hypothetical protein
MQSGKCGLTLALACATRGWHSTHARVVRDYLE